MSKLWGRYSKAVPAMNSSFRKRGRAERRERERKGERAREREGEREKEGEREREKVLSFFRVL